MKSSVPSWANLVHGVPGDLQRQQKMRVEVAPRRFEVEFRKRRIVRTGASDQYMINRCGQLAEEPVEPVEVGSVESGDAGAEVKPYTVQAVGVARREDDRGPLRTREPRRFETDTGAAPDHYDGLPQQLLLPLRRRKGGRGHHDSFQRSSRLRTLGLPPTTHLAPTSTGCGASISARSALTAST
jgi:hypothetical protein